MSRRLLPLVTALGAVVGVLLLGYVALAAAPSRTLSLGPGAVGPDAPGGATLGQAPAIAPEMTPEMAPEMAPEIAPAAARGPATVAADWVSRTATAAGIPEPALRAYATAQLRLAREEPGCHLGWTTLAGIGWVESQHGTHDGRTLGEDGIPSSPILGPALDGSGDVAAVPGADGGWARAAGPMQFLGSTWARWGSDGDGDGLARIQDLDDAAYAAGRYLCVSGSLATGAGWARAVFSYNHSQAYVDSVYAAAQAYAQRTSG